MSYDKLLSGLNNDDLCAIGGAITPAAATPVPTLIGLEGGCLRTVVAQDQVRANETPLAVTDTSTLDFATSGPTGHTLTGSVKVSATPDNVLVTLADGLYVPTPAAIVETPITPIDTNSVDLTVSGITGHILQADSKISAGAGNQVSIAADGLFVPAVVQTPVTPTDTAAIDLTVSGANNHTVQADLKLSSTAGNTATIVADGLYVPATSGETLTVLDTDSIDLTASGTLNHTLQAALRLDPATSNPLMVSPAGLLAPANHIGTLVSGTATTATGPITAIGTTTVQTLTATLTNPSAHRSMQYMMVLMTGFQQFSVIDAVAGLQDRRFRYNITAPAALTVDAFRWRSNELNESIGVPPAAYIRTGTLTPTGSVTWTIQIQVEVISFTVGATSNNYTIGPSDMYVYGWTI